MNKSIETFQLYLREIGLKQTRQRELIATEFFNRNSHVSAEEVQVLVRKTDDKISLATVYRTLRLLQTCKLANAHNFGNSLTRFEPELGHGEHHDHLICTACGKIIEFVNQKIEELQNHIAQSHGFKITNHKMELYGTCNNCSKD